MDEIIDTANSIVGYIVVSFPPAHPATLPATVTLTDRTATNYHLDRAREMATGTSFRYALAEVRLLEEPR